MNNKGYIIREYELGDKAFIMSTFLKSLYYGDSWFSIIPKNIFMDNYKKIVEALITQGVVKIACLPDDKDEILGYSILGKDGTTVHFVYVKKVQRKNGVAKSLIPKYTHTVTHLTELGKILLPKLNNAVFNPFHLGV